MNDPLAACRLCPFQCNVNRLAGEVGHCGCNALPRVALASLHFWEEPCISGRQGSGTVFFSGCNLRCVFCQNQQISRQRAGIDLSIDRLAEIFVEQQQRGAHNLNLVTPTPYAPQIIAALKLARKSGFRLPVIYNTSGYESPATLDLLAGWVDIYLPDLKYFNEPLATALSLAPGYFRHAMAAIEIMLAQVGHCRFDSDGLLQKGVLIRHLALPGQTEDSRSLLAALYRQFGPEIWFSLMNQYTPPDAPIPSLPPELARPLADSEYDDLIDFALSLGLTHGFIQEQGTVSDRYIPHFNLEGVTRRD